MVQVVAQVENSNAEKIGDGFSLMLEGLSGLVSDSFADPTWASLAGWLLAGAAGLWILSRIGLIRR